MLNQLDSAAGNCRVSLPTLFERIGNMAAHGQPPPIGFPAARLQRLRRPKLARTPATRNAGPEVRSRRPVKTTASSIASGPANGSAAAIRTEVAKGFLRPTTEQRTLQTGASSEDRLRRRHRPPLRPDLPKRLHRRGFDNRIRMGIAKPSRGPINGPTARRVLPRPPPVLERAHDRSRKSHRLRRHEDHRQDIGGLYDHVCPHQRYERSRSLLANGRAWLRRPLPGRIRRVRAEMVTQHWTRRCPMLCPPCWPQRVPAVGPGKLYRGPAGA